MSIKNKFATAVATASLLAGLFGSAFVPSALAARDIALDTPSVAKTETFTANDDYIVPVIGSDGVVTGTDRAFWATLVGGIDVDNDYMIDDVELIDDVPTDAQVINYYLETKAGDPIDLADLKATSSSSIIKLAWGYTDLGAAAVCSDVSGTDTFTTTDTVVDVDGEDDAYAVNNLYELCIYSNGKPGTSTISVVANGVTLAPVTITVVGDIASITVVADGTYVAEDNEEVSKFFTVTAKDSAGTVINGPNTGVAGGVYLDNDFIFDYAEDNAVNQQGDEIDFISGGAESNLAELATGVDNYSYNQHALLAGTCVSETATGENDGDAGKSYSLQVEVNNDDDDMVYSPAVSITCTGPGSDAKLLKFEVEATSGDLEYEDSVDDLISIYAYFTDQAGRPLGAGAELDLDVMGLDSSASASFSTDLGIVLYTDNNGATLGGDVVTDGTTKTAIGELSPNMEYVAKFPYTISVDSSDLQSATAVSKSLATFYTATNADAVAYTLTRVRNAAKTRVTLTVRFGAECSNQMVDWDVELANGDVKFLERRANIDGVSTLTMERRNTKIYFIAFCNDGAQYSDLRGIRFR